jgi:hypothetical protein
MYKLKIKSRGNRRCGNLGNSYYGPGDTSSINNKTVKTRL